MTVFFNLATKHFLSEVSRLGKANHAFFQAISTLFTEKSVYFCNPNFLYVSIITIGRYFFD